MKGYAAHLMTLLVVFSLPMALGPGTAPRTTIDAIWPARAAPLGVIGRAPLPFVPNVGQSDPEVRFQVHTMGGTAFFTPGGMVLSLPNPGGSPTNEGGKPDRSADPTSPSTIVRIRFEDARSAPVIEGLGRLPGIVNYFVGDDPTRWHAHLPTYEAVVYRELYAGIDLRYDGKSGGLKGTYLVEPGADPGAIQLAYGGVDRVAVDEQGDLVLFAPYGEIRQEAPRIYQEKEGVLEPVAGGYALQGSNLVGFEIGDYDSTRPLLIDPNLVYSTYLGGSNSDSGSSIAVDSAYNVYVTGGTASTDFPTENPAQGALAGAGDVFVTKLNRHGTEILYSTFLGGNESDQSNEVVVDKAGNAYVVGTTESSNFPKMGAFDSSFVGPDEAFVVKLAPRGSQLVYATFLGGSDSDKGQGIAVDDEGYAYVTGNTQSEDFPTMNPYQGALANELGYAEAFVAKFNVNGSALVYSTYLGGDRGANGYDVAVDDLGKAYVTGDTRSTDFPTTGAYEETLSGGTDAFLSKLSSAGTDLDCSTYLGGGNNDSGLTIGLGGANQAYVGGRTSSSDFPIYRAAQPNRAGTWDGFVTQLGSDCSVLLFSTFLGGSEDEQINSLAVDPFGSVFVTGQTRSTDFPTVEPDQVSNAGTYDVFVAKLYSTGGLPYSCYWGGSGSDYGEGIAIDPAGNAHIAGRTYSSDFPISAGGGGPVDDTYSEGEAFVARASVVAGMVTGQIPPEGGVLSSSAEGVSFVFDSGAFTETVSLTCSLLEADQATGALAGVGRIYDLSAVTSDGRQAARLAPGATYTSVMTYTTSGPAIEETLALYTWDGAEWVEEPTSEVDVETNTVTATPNHLSLWAVLGETRRVFLPLVLRTGAY
jgi:hypothetical protein